MKSAVTFSQLGTKSIQGEFLQNTNPSSIITGKNAHKDVLLSFFSPSPVYGYVPINFESVRRFLVVRHSDYVGDASNSNPIKPNQYLRFGKIMKRVQNR